MKKLLYIFLFCSIPVIAQNQALFEKGNTAYNEGNYNDAIGNYEAILNSGVTSAELYFNLANAYYKLNQVAPSVYYYEKALQLDPNDKEILNNLEYARNMAIDDIEEVEKGGLTKIVNDVISVLSYNGWAKTAIACSALFAVLFLLYYFSVGTRFKRLYFTFSMIFLVLGIVSVGFAFQQESYIESSNFAVVFAEEAPVRSEPNLRSDELFLLHEGTKLEVLETFQDWVKLELANGAVGWIDKNDVRLL